MDSTSSFDNKIQLLTKVMDLRAKNAQVISSNIANAETPGFSPAKFEFEKDLASAIERSSTVPLTTSHSQHIPLGPNNFHSVSGKVIIEKDEKGIGDENGVSIDQEMLALSENELHYETAAQLLKKKISMLKHVVSGGQ